MEVNFNNDEKLGETPQRIKRIMKKRSPFSGIRDKAYKKKTRNRFSERAKDSLSD